MKKINLKKFINNYNKELNNTQNISKTNWRKLKFN